MSPTRGAPATAFVVRLCTSQQSRLDDGDTEGPMPSLASRSEKNSGLVSAYAPHCDHPSIDSTPALSAPEDSLATNHRSSCYAEGARA